MHTPTPAISRRRFLTISSAAFLSLPIIGSRAWGANNRVRVGIIGLGNRGAALMHQFNALPGVEIAALCDPDPGRLNKGIRSLESYYIRQLPEASAPEGDDAALKKAQAAYESEIEQIKTNISRVDRYKDYRKILDRSDIDAVVIASPNHWHTLHAIHAMQAGKHVYVEKPVSHSIWEGQQLVAAEKKYNRIACAGFQNRSDAAPTDGIRYAQEGHMGKILSVHVACLNNRKSIGPIVNPPLTPPSEIDYNLWLGPAQDLPITRKKFHYDWHWIWNTGNGDVGNLAPHDIDLACWTLGDGPLPTKVQCFGGRNAWNDAGQTPNQLTVWYEQAGIPVTIEVNNITLSPTVNAAPTRNGIRIGVVIKCEGGEVRGGRGGMYAVAEDGKTKLQSFRGDGGGAHPLNFIEAIRSGDTSKITSRLTDAEKSSAIAHLANLSYRSGRRSDENAITQATKGNSETQEILQDQHKQLLAWGISKPEYSLGSQIEIDKNGQITGEGVKPEWIHTPGRGEFIVPTLA